MKLFGLSISRAQPSQQRGIVVNEKWGGQLVDPNMRLGMGFWGMVRESFTGAWQRNITIDNKEMTQFSAVYACVTTIAQDIAKLRIKLVQEVDGIWPEVTDRRSPYLALFRKPNQFQTSVQFLTMWLTSKLLHGNTYVLLVRDGRQFVKAMYVLDPTRVTPLVTDLGDVYYRLKRDMLSGVFEDDVVVPASEIIHDKMVTLFHPLCGVTPIFACGISATQGVRIQQNSALFFQNMSRPSGMLTAPGEIKEETATRLKDQFEKALSGVNFGRLLVAGDGLKYEPLTMTATDAQLIEQLKWTVEDVARCFKVPLHMLGGNVQPTYNNVAALNQAYYSQTLQVHIESIEALLDEALALPASNYAVELDLSTLFRMDPAARYAAHEQGIRAGWLKPNEARRTENLEPVPGGDTPYMQQQNYSLAALALRDANDPFAKPPPPAPVAVEEEGEEDEDEEEDDEDSATGGQGATGEGDEMDEADEAKLLVAELIKRFSATEVSA